MSSNGCDTSGAREVVLVPADDAVGADAEHQHVGLSHTHNLRERRQRLLWRQASIRSMDVVLLHAGWRQEHLAQLPIVRRLGLR